MVHREEAVDESLHEPGGRFREMLLEPHRPLEVRDGEFHPGEVTSLMRFDHRVALSPDSDIPKGPRLFAPQARCHPAWHPS